MMSLMIPTDPSSSEGLTIEELAARAGVTPRTVHYYVAQGLLPGPGKQGPRTRYTPAFLDLLLRIRQLQNERDLSLRSIRQMFAVEGLIPARSQVRSRSRRGKGGTNRGREAHADEKAAGDEMIAAVETGGSASGRRGSGAQDASRDLQGAPEQEPSNDAASPTATDFLAALQRLVGERRVPSAGSGDRWVTVPISRDLVLAGRRLRNDDLQALQRAADYLRFVLLNDNRPR